MSTTRNADPLEALGLTQDQTVLYTTVLKLHRATLAEIAYSVDQPADDVLDRLTRLVRLGAVEEQDGKYLARHPAAAIGRLVAERLDRLARESRQIDEALASVGRLTHHYDAGRDYQSGRFAVELVSGADELYESVVGLALQNPPADMVFAIDDRRTMSDFAEKYTGPWIQAIKDGVLSSRTVIPVSVMTAPGVREVCDRLIEAGAGIRTLDRVPSWFFALGEDTVGLPAEWGDPLPEHAYNCSLVRAPIVVAALRSLFEELWARATPVESPNGAHQVLRLAAQGLSDESIARHLGVSVRTVRARFAEAMAELGVHTRFHAGAEAARRGWL
ncbi:LuxR C-terminal-related transcriptional regulator [Planotetraspora sp. A-T 1434]|uniref:helix-turn-helix transcriptional regulator n=1 Tax=Planotetraspora sp. A-T 1434 TaxID=2979219 RepID=UPI0021C03227|nr:LuxR C-terminal-related transcriptional regulator [Planotetraspora sp. A-T 1434]MCT9928664.1 LuxR C-terminal-related transcriptional regulator [Planotetraspora sp. A-T 1434]